jgi:hypothetical protein
MNARTWTLAMALAVAVPPAAHAAGNDSLRCEAIAMRKEGQRFDCLGRCQRRSDRRAAQLGTDAAAGLTSCQQDCEDRFASAMTQLDQREVCGGGPPGPRTRDPNKCQARLMRTKATLLMCDSDCARASNDPDTVRACFQQCGTRYATAVDDLLAQPICAGVSAPE